MAKYKVLRGTHQVTTVTEREGGVAFAEAQTFRVGDVFEVPGGKNYAKRIARLRSKRFLVVPDDTPVKSSLPPEPEDTTPGDQDSPEKPSNQVLEATQGMTIAALREQAAINGIDLAGATRRDEILKRLQEHA